MASKPNIYIVHGAGYSVMFSQLPRGTVDGTEVPFAAIPERRGLADLILVGHSSGGRVTTGAAEGLDATSRRRQAMDVLTDLPEEEQQHWGVQNAHTTVGLFDTPSTLSVEAMGSLARIFTARWIAAKKIDLDCGHFLYVSMVKELLAVVEELLCVMEARNGWVDTPHKSPPGLLQ
ncbi:uncharacterized protein B0T23DRAFT_405306 [Neurospora hispaniola]|uniref:Uncharacterized protein n=1 Tax=Neurospora hispaniola TaxID=588809 RepID=A0AAJ0I5J2_9PEZI|nr:hypothetical protein B0T23DRAFT_405306 [Neurospora hispaniola]